MHAVHGNKHRQLWIEDKLFELTTIFAIDLCTYAVIHNPYHVVLLINKSSADDWVPLENVERWHRLNLTGFFVYLLDLFILYLYHSPVTDIDCQGSLTGKESPFCKSSIEILSGERTKAMWPSLGGTFKTTLLSSIFWHKA
jgi:hypothetical protein